jgi:hypothetical protein
MHSVRRTLSQAKALSGMRPGSGIPSISTVHAQARCRCAQIIHMFVHSQQVSSPLVPRRAGSRSARPGLPDTASTPDREAPGPGRVRSRKEADRGCSPPLWSGRRARRLPGGSRAYRLRSRRCRPGTSPVRSSATQVIAASIPAAAACRSRQGRSGRAESDRAPPCMRWRGPARPRRTGWSVAWPGRRRAPPAGARYPREGPVSRFLPRSRGRPRWCPFPAARHFYCVRWRRARARGQTFRVFPPSAK